MILRLLKYKNILVVTRYMVINVNGSVINKK